ncbi:MAG TPA: haloalkane dehalogenase [Anaerolineae bacterium]|nr:haloalkane dehalogenase [Anaerolineae bacterium]
MSRYLRTPDDRFQNLPDYPFTPHYLQQADGLRLHYLDEGPPDAAETILCLHGEPSWSFLYRHMIPLLGQHHRVLAPDFIGFGRSDKLPSPQDYSFQFHLDTLVWFLDRLDLTGVTIVVQDWGGLLGLTAVSQHPHRFRRLVIMNTFLPTGHEDLGEAFYKWQRFSQRVPDLPIGRIIKGSLAPGNTLPPEVIAGYEAPFPDASYKAGAAIWPSLVPTTPEDDGAAQMAAARHFLQSWDRPALVMFSDSDPITGGAAPFFRQLIPTASKQPGIVIKNAGHFLQEEQGPTIAQHILEFISRTPIPPPANSATDAK